MCGRDGCHDMQPSLLMNFVTQFCFDNVMARASVLENTGKWSLKVLGKYLNFCLLRTYGNAGVEIRTFDLRVISPLLYQLR